MQDQLLHKPPERWKTLCNSEVPTRDTKHPTISTIDCLMNLSDSTQKICYMVEKESVTHCPGVSFRLEVTASGLVVTLHVIH